MSKKSKSQIRRERASTSTTVSPVSEKSRSTEFNPDYSYVVSDLRRIGLLDGTFIVLLIVLAILLPIIT